MNAMSASLKGGAHVQKTIRLITRASPICIPPWRQRTSMPGYRVHDRVHPLRSAWTTAAKAGEPHPATWPDAVSSNRFGHVFRTCGGMATLNAAQDKHRRQGGFVDPQAKPCDRSISFDRRFAHIGMSSSLRPQATARRSGGDNLGTCWQV